MLSNPRLSAFTFLPHHLKRELKELYFSVAIMDFAIAAIVLFEPIYLYTLGYSLKIILLFYLEVYLVYFIILPVGAKYASHFGYEHSMSLSTIFLVGYYLSLFAVAHNPLFLVIAPLFFAVQKTLYWSAYHADFARFSDGQERGRQLSELAVIDSLVYILGPFIGGVILTVWGFPVLFAFVSILILGSSLPILSTKEKFTPKDFSYEWAYQRLFRKENRRKLLAYLGFGEELIVMVIWPIFIYLVIKNFFQIGLVVTLATLVTAVATLYIGRLTDRSKKQSVLRFGAVSSALIWLVRLGASAGWHVFFIDSLSRITKNTVTVPLVALTYDRAQSHSIMKSVVFFEMALVVGKLLVAMTIFILLFFFPPALSFPVAFVIGAGMTLLYVLL